jgi:hypothetical protein
MSVTRISVRRALLMGTLVVNVPVWLLLIGLPAAAGAFEHQLGKLALAGFPIGFVLAWLWWSLSVPRWRLWAYERVDSIVALKRSAVSAGLTWPDGSFFARTEIKSGAHAARERALERGRGRR